MKRRSFLRLGAIGAAAVALPHRLRAQTFPARPVRLIVGFAPGSASDIGARLVAERLSERLGQPFVVENRPGAASNIATEYVVRAPADGYTLLYVVPPNAINASLYADLSYNFLRDTTPVASILSTPAVMEVGLAVPAKTVPEFIAYAKANPGKLNFATLGPGSGQHLFGELFKMMAGVDLVPVHYRGAAQALQDMIAGRVQVMFDIVVSSIAQIKAGQLRALAVTTAAPLDILPDVPTVAAFVPGYQASGWHGICAPAGTPPDIVDKLNKEVNVALADTGFTARLADVGGIAFASTPKEFGGFLADETEKWGRVIRAANIKVE